MQPTKPPSTLESLAGEYSVELLHRCVDAGFVTVLDLATATPAALVANLSLSDQEALALVGKAQELSQPLLEFSTSSELRAKEISKLFISTGSDNLDSILGGGLEAGSITEAAGEFGTGKSQIAMSAAVSCASTGKHVLYFDNEYTYRADRVQQMVEARGLNGEEIHSRIHVAKPVNLNHQEKLIKKVWTMAESFDFGLIVMDSLTKHFATEYGRDEIVERQQRLNRNLRELQRLAMIHKLAVYITNQVRNGRQSQTDARFQSPSGGNILAHASTHRLYLFRANRGSRTATIIDSPNLPESEAGFRITTKGIESA